MASLIEQQMADILDKRRERSLIRRLVVIPSTSADFSSNDFLGLARNPRLAERFMKELASFPKDSPPLGSTGSRLLDGNSQYAEDLEKIIANFHSTEAALIFNSGFDANVGFFSSVPQPNDVILFDEFIHASVHDGMKVSRASLKRSFPHNDLTQLTRIIKALRAEEAQDPSKFKTARNIFVAVESIYSMDGDMAPLVAMADLVDKYGAHLIVDEAHATGVFGKNGRGLVNAFGLEHRVFARLHTFSKGLGCNGAALVGSQLLKTYLINYARPLIYSTFTSFNNLACIKSAYQMLMDGETDDLVKHVFGLVDYFRTNINVPKHMLLPSQSPIQGIVMNGNAKVNALSARLVKSGLNVKPIRFPTVPKGRERVRICLHSHNTQEQVRQLISICQEWIAEQQDLVESMAAEAAAAETRVGTWSENDNVMAQAQEQALAVAATTSPLSLSSPSSAGDRNKNGNLIPAQVLTANQSSGLSTITHLRQSKL